MVNRLKNRTNRLPSNIRNIEHYFEHMKAPARLYKKDEKGNEYAIFVEGNKPDHYFHAEVYDEIAVNIIKQILEDNSQGQEEIITQEEVGIERVEIGGGY